MDRPRSSAVLRLPRARRVGPGARLFTYRGFEAASARATPGWAASDPSTSRPGYETQFSNAWCSLSFAARTRRLGSVEGRAGAGARPAALAARSTACCGHCCSSCGSPPPAPLQLAPLERRRRWSPASLRLAHKHWGSAGGSFNYTFTPCSALVGGSSRSRCAAAMLCRDAPLGQPSGTSSSAARGLTPWPPSRTRCDSDGDAGGNESLAAAAARRASAGGRASRVLLLAVRAPLRAAIVVTIAYADSGGKSSPAEVHGARQRRSPSSPPATAPSPP